MISLDWHKDESGKIILDITSDKKTAYQAGMFLYSAAEKWLPELYTSPFGRVAASVFTQHNGFPFKVNYKIR
jgi:hypothetical protein